MQTIQVSSIQLSKTSSAHWIMSPLPQAKSLHAHFQPPLPTSTYPTSPFPSGHHHTILCVYVLCIYVFWLIPSPSFIRSPFPFQTFSSIKRLYIILHSSLFGERFKKREKFVACSQEDDLIHFRSTGSETISKLLNVRYFPISIR